MPACCDLQPLNFNVKLRCAARKHAKDMARRNYFSHDTLGSGMTASDRVTAAGYRWSTTGENIAAGLLSPPPPPPLPPALALVGTTLHPMNKCIDVPPIQVCLQIGRASSARVSCHIPTFVLLQRATFRNADMECNHLHSISCRS